MRSRIRGILEGRAARADDDDVVQRVWVGVLRRPAPSGTRRVVNWLVQIARREALLTANYGGEGTLVDATGRARADRRPIGGVALTAGIVDCSPQPDELAEQRRTLRRVRAAARLLTTHEREAFWGGVIDGEPDDTGSSTRRVLAHTARAKLRRVV